jgi:RHS repeat-associated protein
VYYGGNVSAMTWKATEPTTSVRGYSFTYDALSQLSNAVYGEGTAINTNTLRYDESFTYDKHGNVNTLKRYGLKDNNTFGLIDDLNVTYVGNTIRTISDAVTVNQNSSDVMEFKFNSEPVNDGHYFYWGTGDLAVDYHKLICMIKYNYLTLPKSVQFRKGDRIEYVYDAAGVRRQTTHKVANRNMNYSYWSLDEPQASDFITSATVTTNYLGNKVYVNNQLKYIMTEEGYIEKAAGSNTYTAHYYLNDHLGSRRVVMDAAGTVKQVNNFYPSGTSIAEYPRRTDQGVQPWKFESKELDRTNGLDFYDFEARAYDPVLMRFTRPDPLAEKYPHISPYVFCANNPVRFVDPDGRDIILWNVYKTNDISGGYLAKKGVSATTKAALKDLMKTTEGQNFFGQFAKAGDIVGDHEFTKDGALSDKTLTLRDYSFEEGYNSNLPITKEGSIIIQDSDVTIKVFSSGESKTNVGEILTHETQLHGHKVKDKMEGKSTTTTVQDHKALKSKDVKHKGYQKYDSTRKALETIDPSYKDSFKEAEKYAERNY